MSKKSFVPDFSDNHPERELVSLCLKGQECARTRLVDSYLADVYRVCHAILGNEHDAEDATQDCFVRVFRFLDKWDGRPLRPWVLTIAANVSRSRRRAGKVVGELPEQLAGKPEENPNEEWVAGIPLEGAILEGLKLLREEYRMVLVLHHQLNQPVEKVGQILDKPTGTVKTWLARGRKALWSWLVASGHLDGVSNSVGAGEA